MTATEDHSRELCPTPNKVRFATLEAAREALPKASFAVGAPLVPYDTCACGWIHLTKEKEQGPAYTELQLIDMSQPEFNALVRMDVTGRGNPETFKGIETHAVLSRWDDSLKVFLADLQAQLEARVGDKTPGSRDWRKRIGRIRVATLDRRAGIQHRRKQAEVAARRIERQRAKEIGADHLNASEFRIIAGRRAEERLKQIHWQEFLTILKEEHEALGVPLGSNLQRALRHEKLRALETERPE